MAWYDQIPEGIQFGDEAKGSTAIGNYGSIMPVASDFSNLDFSNLDFSNLNLGNMDYSNWGTQNFVPDYQPAPTTPSYQPAPTTSYMDYASPLATSYQSYPTPQPTTAMPYTDYTSPLASSYLMQPTAQPTSAMPYTDYTSPLGTSSLPNYNYDYSAPDYNYDYQSYPTPQPTTAVPYYGGDQYGNDFSGRSPLASRLWQNEAGLDDYGYQQPYQQPDYGGYLDTPTLQNSFDATSQMGALPAAQPAAPAAISANSPPPGTTWGVYSDPNDTNSQYTVNFSSNKRGALPLTVSNDTPVFLYDNKTKQVLASGIGKEGADAVAAAVYKLNNDPKGSSYWDIYTGPAGATDSSQFKVAVTDPRDKNFGQRFLSAVGTMLPLAVSFIPGLGQASLLTQIGAGAATGAASSALKGQDILKGGLLGGATAGLVNAPILSGGRSISDALSKAVGLGGNTANVGDLQARAIDTTDLLTGLGVNPGLASQIASGSLSNIGNIGGGAISSAIPGSSAGGNLIQVIGNKGISNIPKSFLTGALGAAGTALSGANYGDRVWDPSATPETEVREPGSSEYDPETGITVTSGKFQMPFDPSSTLNTVLNTDFSGAPDYSGYEDLINKYNDMYDIQGPEEEIPEGSDEGWTVEAPKENVVLPPPASLPELFDPLNSVDIPTDLVKEWPEIPAEEDNGWTVNGYPPRAPGLLPVVIPPLNSVNVPPADTFQPSKDKSILDEIKKYTELAQLAATGLAPLFGGGGGGSSGAGGYAGMRGPLSAVFSAKLPKPTMQMAMPRALNFDAYRYGYGPEQSFFTNVPQGAENTSTAYTGYGASPRYNATQQYASDFEALVEKLRKQREEDELEAAAAALGLPGYAEGGYAVGGAGDGRDDKIPAMLSDGEYVIDAETVALLGNGSNKAGADLLDKFRVNVRKHKGRELAKGDFSAKAKKPEQYLKGRK